MILVDTSVWIDHLRFTSEALEKRLSADEVVAHPFIIGELALGNFRHRPRALRAIIGMPQLFIAGEDELIDFIIRYALSGSGIGHVDAHILLSAHATPGMALWTHDKRLNKACMRLGVATL